MSGNGDYIEREKDKYIKLSQALEVLDSCSCWWAHERMERIPAADVRPVVLCRDCKYWELSKIEPPFCVCTYVCGATFVREAEDFCSRGEKREKN